MARPQHVRRPRLGTRVAIIAGALCILYSSTFGTGLFHGRHPFGTISEAAPLTDRGHGDCFAPVDFGYITTRLCREWGAGTASSWVYIATWTDALGQPQQITVPALNGPTEPMR